MLKKIITIISLATIICCFPDFVFALTVALKSGKIVNAETFEVTDAGIKLKTGDAVTAYDKKEIAGYYSKEPPELKDLEEFNAKFKECEAGAKYVKESEFGGVYVAEITGPKDGKCLVKESMITPAGLDSFAESCEYETSQYDSYAAAVESRKKQGGACQESLPSSYSFFPVIRLKSGESVRGELLGINDKAAELNVNGNKTAYAKEQIEAMVFGKQADFYEFEDKFKECREGAELFSDFGGVYTAIEIIGLKEGKCQVREEIVGHPNDPQALGRSMVCEYDISKYKNFTSALKDRNNEICSGTLAELMFKHKE